MIASTKLTFLKEKFRLLSYLHKKTIDDLICEEPVLADHLVQPYRDCCTKPLKEVRELYSQSILTEVRSYLLNLQAFHRHQGICLNNKSIETINQISETEIGKTLVDNLFDRKALPVYVFTQETNKALDKCAPQLFDKAQDLIVDLPNQEGLAIVQTDWAENYEKPLYLFYSVQDGYIFFFSALDEKGSYRVAYPLLFDCSKDIELLLERTKTTQSIYDKLVLWMLLSVLFINFFETDKVILQATPNTNKSVRTIQNETIYTSTVPYPIHVLNAFWFTNLIKLDPFLVKGHFRKQRYGKGRSDYKVIWIKGHSRKGYTRKAGRLTEGKLELPLEKQSPDEKSM